MPQATRLAAAVKKAFPGTQVDLIRGGRGDFIVVVDGTRELWNKRQMDDAFPEETELIARMKD